MVFAPLAAQSPLNPVLAGCNDRDLGTCHGEAVRSKLPTRRLTGLLQTPFAERLENITMLPSSNRRGSHWGKCAEQRS